MAAVSLNSMNNVVQNQLTRSLEKILEDANFSGELKLSGRKLKEFPKGKYNLSDTVFADLSKNRFCELPNDVTAFHFLERLLLYHNAIRNIPESVGALQSLTYLDLSRNHLTTLPREICLLPLEVLLVSNNRLVSLPDELGRMSQLSELDASCNFLAHLPVRIGELQKLRVLNLRSNALVYLPLEVVNLKLISLNLSSNRISMLPVEMRLMDNLINLDISHNPLTVPPANLCEKGMVHIFKYLETQYIKNGGGPFKQISMTTAANVRIAGTTASPISTPSKTYSTRAFSHTNSLDSLKSKRPHVDSGYCTSDGFDKHWIADIQDANGDIINQYQNLSSSLSSNSSQDTITPMSGAPLASSDSRSGSSTPSTISPGPSEITANRELSDDRLANIQTYREYKEALRQQRQLDGHVVYRSKEHTPPTPQTPETNFQSTIMNQNSDHKFISSSPNTPLSSRREYGHNNEYCNSLNQHQQIPKYMNGYSNGQTGNNGLNGTHSSIGSINPILNGNSINRKPVQKVTPSRNIMNDSLTNEHNKINSSSTDEKTDSVKNSPQSPYKNFCNKNDIYVKPNSPIKQTSNILSHNNVPVANRNGSFTKNGNKSLDWESNSPDKLDKFSFTMKREFDKQKEETELIEQLRNIIESRLKMTLPQDLGSALTDGVVLCHLANQVSPRAVATIHVPSATVPKLTMARCRRNVDNFLEACRKIGVEETLLPSRDLLIGSNCASDTSSAHQPDFPVEDRTVNKTKLLTLARLCNDLVNGNHQNNGPEKRWIIENAENSELHSNGVDKRGNYGSDMVRIIENGCVDNMDNKEKRVLSENMEYVIECLENHAIAEQMSRDKGLLDQCDTTDEITKVNGDVNRNGMRKPVDNGFDTLDGLGDKPLNKKRVPDDSKLKNIIKYFEATKDCDNTKLKKDIRNVSDKFQVPIEKDAEACDNIADTYKSGKITEKIIYDKSQMSLYLKKNLNEEMKLDTVAHNRLVTIICLSGFLFTVIILTLFPLPG